MAGCYQEHPDGEFATCHLSPCGSHQALPWLGQPTAIGRSSSKVSPGFWKTSIFPEANVCPIYTRRTEASSLTGTATWEGHECVPARGFKSLLPKQCLVTRQRQCPQKLFGSGGGFSAPPAPRGWGAFFQPTHTCQTSHICGGGAMASIGAQGHCLCTTFLGLSCPRNPTPVPCPLPEPGSPSPWDSCQASPVSKNPLTQHVDPTLGLRQHEGTAHRSRMLGDK